MKYPKLIEERNIIYNSDNKINIAIYKTTYFYDIIISGDNNILLELKKQDKYANYIDYSNFGYPILVWDTTDSLDEAKYIVEELCNSFGKW